MVWGGRAFVMAQPGMQATRGCPEPAAGVQAVGLVDAAPVLLHSVHSLAFLLHGACASAPGIANGRGRQGRTGWFGWRHRHHIWRMLPWGGRPCAGAAARGWLTPVQLDTWWLPRCHGMLCGLKIGVQLGFASYRRAHGCQVPVPLGLRHCLAPEGPIQQLGGATQAG